MAEPRRGAASDEATVEATVEARDDLGWASTDAGTGIPNGNASVSA